MTATVYTPIESAEDLRARIREVGATEPDPVWITDLVLRSLSRPEEFRAIAAEALPAYVHHELAMADVERARGGVVGCLPGIGCSRGELDRSRVCFGELALPYYICVRSQPPLQGAAYGILHVD